VLIFDAVYTYTLDTNVSEKHAVSIFIPEDGDIMFLRNTGIYLQVYMAS
jgi:hypothetical protein